MRVPKGRDPVAAAWSVRTVGAAGRRRVVDEVLVVDPTLPGGVMWAGCADVLVCAAGEGAWTSNAWAARMLEVHPGAGLAGTVSPKGCVRGLVRGGPTLRIESDAAGAEGSWERGVEALVAIYARWCIEPSLVGGAPVPGVDVFPRPTTGGAETRGGACRGRPWTPPSSGPPVQGAGR